MKKIVIFDLDGTLLNTIGDLAAATNHTLESMGYAPLSTDAVREKVGNGVKILLQRALPPEARTTRNIEAAHARFADYYDSHLTDRTTVYDGVRQLLKDLRQRQIDLAVASNKYQSAVERLVKHFFEDIEFAAVCGQQTGVPIKPDPSIIFGILSECPCPKDGVLYCGDSGVDMQTARRAGVESCGVTWGFRPESDLTDNFAGHIVHHPSQILDLV